MHRATHSQREEFVARIQEHAGGESSKRLWFAERLMRYGATLGRIAENQCNGYRTWDHKWDEEAAKRDARKEQRIQVKVGFLCDAFGCKPVFQGDPRGATVRIVVPDGYTNDWGRTGVCVPTS